MMEGLTGREKRAAVYAAALLYGFTHKGFLASAAKFVFSGLMVKEVVGFLEDQKLFAFPETMNAFFKSGGTVSSVTGGKTHANVIRRTRLVHGNEEPS